MNDVQSLIDRQLGIYSHFNYDNVLKRLVVHSDESFYGLQSPAQAVNFDQDPPIFACRFAEASGYEHVLALANEDGRVAIQDTTTLRSASTVEGFQCHNNAVFDLAWMPYHMNFVTVSGDHTACLWDVSESSPKRVLLFSHHTRSVKTAVFRPNEPSVFATGARDGHILLWDIRANNQPAVVLKPDNCLMSCHSSFTPKTPGSHSKRPRIENHRAISITGLVFRDDLTLISCGECDGNIKVWDLRKNYNVYKREPLPKHSIAYCGSSAKNGYTNLIVDDARMRLYASCMDDVIYCFNISTYNALPERRYVGHENSTFYIKTGLSPDSVYLVSGSSDKNAYVWNVRYSRPVVKLSGHRAEVTCAAWCQKGDMKIVTCSDDAMHKIWRIGREVREIDADLKGFAEVVPRAEVCSPPQWGGSERTPSSSKRKTTTTPNSHSAKRARPQKADTGRKTKRSLTDSMNAIKEADEQTPHKRPRLEAHSIPGRERLCFASDDASCKTKYLDSDLRDSISTEWTHCAPVAASSFTSPDRDNKERNRIPLSLEGHRAVSSDSIAHRTPVKVSPTKVRIVSFTTPTMNLPNFVLDGEAPHLRLMSPAKKKRESVNWLTLMVREKKGKCFEAAEKVSSPTSLNPKEKIPTRRNSVTEKTTKSNVKTKTLLNYFSLNDKEQ